MTDQKIPPWLDSSHPNFKRWNRSRKLSEDRGRFVKSVIENIIHCEKLNILDLGSGEGGTSWILSDKNFVVSLDISLDRLKRQKDKSGSYELILCDAALLPFKENFFDLIILQDVIEHVTSPVKLIENIYKILKPGGVVYLSTPNKLSVVNLIADPHWGMPFVSILSRESIKKYFLKYFRKSECGRQDAAQLLSLHGIKKLLNGKFTVRLYTKHAVKRLFSGDKGIVWSDFHLSLIRLLKNIYLDKLIIYVANDGIGLLNIFFNPTFYFILKKKEMQIKV